MKKYLFGALALVLAVGFSAFTVKKANKPFASQTIYYQSGEENQRVEQGFDASTHPFNPEEWTMSPASFDDMTNWTITPVSYSPYVSGPESYVGSFMIDNYQAVSDGDDSNGISIQEALTAIRNALTSGGQFFYPTNPAYTLDVDTDNNSSNNVTVRNFDRAASAH